MMFRAFGATDQGRVRDVNEDNLLVVTPPDGSVGLFVVADGAGGAAHGDVASRLYVDELRRFFDAERDRFAEYDLRKDQELRKPLVELLVTLMNRAGNAVFELSQNRRAMSGMCTTATVLVLCNGAAFLGHVGDARAYLIREGVTYRVTEDHTWANELAQQCDLSPGQITSAPYGHVVTRTFGFAPQMDVDTLFFPVRPADRFVLCTDGLYRYVRGREIEAVSPTCPDAQALAGNLINRANERGGEDNVTVVVAETVAADGADAPLAVGFHEQVGLLRSLFLFEFLSDQEIMRVMRIVYQQQRSAGDRIIEEGTEGREIFIVVHGSVEVSVQGEHLTSVGVGGHFGELALIDHQARSATVTATEDVVLLTIDHQDFYGLVRSEHSLASKLLWSFLKNVAGRVRDLSDEVGALRSTLAHKQ